MGRPDGPPHLLHEGADSFSGRWLSSSLAQGLTFFALDILIVWTALVLAYFARFEGAIPHDFITIIVPVAVIASIIFPALFWVSGLYGYLWRYVGVPALVRLGWVTAVGMGIMLALDIALARPPLYRPIPLGTLTIFGIIAFLGFFVVRMFGRLIAYVQVSQQVRNAKRVLIVGAGSAAALLVRDIESNPEIGVQVVGFSDDDPAKKGRRLGRSRVLGDIEQVATQAENVDADEIWIAMPNTDEDSLRRVLYLCAGAKCPVKIVPSMTGSGGQVLQVSDLKQVELEQLLHREPIVTDLSAVFEAITGKRVLVTGAAGSIGSELCRQISSLSPSALIMLEIDESRLYEMFLEIREVAGPAAIMALCDIRDRSKMRALFARERPDVVIHTAAYKHVPLMEMEPDEAVRSNILGTMHVLECCTEFGVDDFVLISTDKAVCPSTVMGATKRAAEFLALSAARDGVRVSVVRFGNVLGSRGSVVPIFESALRRGDTLRITDSDVTRFFLTIPEAVQLVLQAWVLTDSCDLFVLDMGEPVRVLDLAQSLIEATGGGGQVEFSGLRPAEKLHEVLCNEHEELIETTCLKVRRLSSLPVVRPTFRQAADEVVLGSRGADGVTVRDLLRGLVPEYRGNVDGS